MQDRERWNPQAPAIYVGPRADANRGGVIPRAELERPCCEVCYKPGRHPFCTRCEGSPAARRRMAL
jgi:hypothetical protein